MLVSRQHEPEHSHWSSFNKFAKTPFHDSNKLGHPSPPRMSGHFDTPSLSTLHQQQGQQGHQTWHGQYSYLPQSAQHGGSTSDTGTAFSHPFEYSRHGQTTLSSASRPSAAVKDEHNSAPLQQRRSIDPLGLRRADHAEPASQTASYTSNVVSRPSQSTDMSRRPVSEDMVGVKEEEDELMDDDELGEGETEKVSMQPMTAAERMAAKRKMKRFRLTHQQTRFLTIEFAKQPHPDAANRERLSGEIPGLSPRQVQVWFQNRRAKIKRLTADDRDRVLKMRAVPDDFDNVQALHSPYGAVHNLGTPIGSPVDFCPPPAYADHMIRPLMVDVRRTDDDQAHMSSAGLSSAYGSLGYAPSSATSLGTPDLLSPLSPPSSAGDRCPSYGSHLSSISTSTLSSRTPFTTRHHGVEGGLQMHHRPGGIRPLQPLQLNRNRTDTLNSPLRAIMSWKEGRLDYSTYPNSASPQLGGAHSGMYQGDQVTGPSSGGLASFESSSYSNTPVMNYSSRLRASSATSPPNLDFRTQYRPISSAVQSPSASGFPRPSSTTAGSPTSAPLYGTARATGSSGSTTQAMSSNAAATNSYSSSFHPAPLSAPVDFSLSRGNQTSQISASIAPPHDYAQACQANLTRPTIRDSFSGGAGLGLLGHTRDLSAVREADRSPDASPAGEDERDRGFGMSGVYQ